MELADMKLPKKSKEELKKDSYPSVVEAERDRWPYGLQLRFETEQVSKLPILTKVKVGDKILVTAEAMVTEVRMSETQATKGEDKVRHTVELQVEQIGCEFKTTKPLEKMNPKEYREARSN